MQTKPQSEKRSSYDCLLSIDIKYDVNDFEFQFFKEISKKH